MCSFAIAITVGLTAPLSAQSATPVNATDRVALSPQAETTGATVLTFDRLATRHLLVNGVSVIAREPAMAWMRPSGTGTPFKTIRVFTIEQTAPSGPCAFTYSVSVTNALASIADTTLGSFLAPGVRVGSGISDCDIPQ